MTSSEFLYLKRIGEDVEVELNFSLRHKLQELLLKRLEGTSYEEVRQQLIKGFPRVKLSMSECLLAPDGCIDANFFIIYKSDKGYDSLYHSANYRVSLLRLQLVHNDHYDLFDY